MKKFIAIVSMISLFVPLLALAALYKSPDGKVWTEWNGKRRWIRTLDIFNSYGFQWPNVQNISYLSLSKKTINNLVRVKGKPEVYALSEDGYKRHIQSPDIFNSYNLSWSDVAEINETELAGYQECNLVKEANNEKVYKLDGNIIHPIKDIAAFNYHGLNWSALQTINSVDLATYTIGAEITDTDLVSPLSSSSPTPTPSSTPIPSVTPSPSITPSPSATPSITPIPLPSATPTIAPTPSVSPSPTPSPSVTPMPTPVSQQYVTVSSDKSQIGANGQDIATITINITNASGAPFINKAIQEISPETKTLVTDTNGNATVMITAKQAGNIYFTVAIDGKYYNKTINAINTTGNVSMSIYHSGSIIAGGAMRAPASDQILSFFTTNSIDGSISELKIKSIKLKLVNLNQTWFKNVRITNSPPCTQGRFCGFQTIAGPASYDFGLDGILTVTPNIPVDVYTGNPHTIYVIMDTLASLSSTYGTNNPMVTYQISLPETSSIELVGKVNGYTTNTINLNLTGNGTAPATATINSNTCYSDSGLVACY